MWISACSDGSIAVVLVAVHQVHVAFDTLDDLVLADLKWCNMNRVCALAAEGIGAIEGIESHVGSDLAGPRQYTSASESR